MPVVTTPEAPADWDDFVSAQPGFTPYHLAAAVNIGREAFNLRCHFMVARDAAGAIVGTLPLVEQSSLPFGKFLTSVPFFNYGGMLLRDPARAADFMTACATLGKERGVRHVELRQVEGDPELAWPSRRDKVSMLLPLPGTDAELGKALGSKLRSQIKRAEREQPEICWGGAELLPAFYSVFCEVMRDLGTPVYPLRFFAAVWAALGERSRVLVIRCGGEPRAAAIVIRHTERLEVPWAAATDVAKRGSLNMRMYWELLRHGVATGASAFDFGRSTVDSGTYRFKSQWGAQPLQLRWDYWLPDAAQLPMLNGSNPKFALATTLWRKLPLWAANRIGPHIIRNLP